MYIHRHLVERSRAIVFYLFYFITIIIFFFFILIYYYCYYMPTCFWQFACLCCAYSFTEKEITTHDCSLYKYADTHAREVQQQALAAMFGEWRPCLVSGGHVWWVAAMFGEWRPCLVSGGHVWWAAAMFGEWRPCLLSGGHVWWVAAMFGEWRPCLLSGGHFVEWRPFCWTAAILLNLSNQPEFNLKQFGTHA